MLYALGNKGSKRVLPEGQTFSLKRFSSEDPFFEVRVLLKTKVSVEECFSSKVTVLKEEVP